MVLGSETASSWGWCGAGLPAVENKVKVAESCPPLCSPMDYMVYGLLQARILEWVALPLLQGIFPTQGSNPGPLHCGQIPYQLSHKGSPRTLEWVAYPFSRGSSWPRKNQGLLHCRQILYQLSLREAQPLPYTPGVSEHVSDYNLHWDSF